MIVDNDLDDKCNNCGEWTRRAYEEYGGAYNDGSLMDYCHCDYAEDGTEDLAPSRVYCAHTNGDLTERLIAA